MALCRHYGLTFYQLLFGMSILPAYFCELFSVDNRRILTDAPVFVPGKSKICRRVSTRASPEGELSAKLTVGVDAHIDPLGNREFAEDF